MWQLLHSRQMSRNKVSCSKHFRTHTSKEPSLMFALFPGKYLLCYKGLHLWECFLPSSRSFGYQWEIGSISPKHFFTFFGDSFFSREIPKPAMKQSIILLSLSHRSLTVDHKLECILEKCVTMAISSCY